MLLWRFIVKQFFMYMYFVSLFEQIDVLSLLKTCTIGCLIWFSDVEAELSLLIFVRDVAWIKSLRNAFEQSANTVNALFTLVLI